MLKYSKDLNKLLKKAADKGEVVGAEEFLAALLEEMKKNEENDELLCVGITISFSNIDLPKAEIVLKKRIEERKSDTVAAEYFEYILNKAEENAVFWKLDKVTLDAVVITMALEPDECMREALGDCCPTKYDLFDPEDIDDE